MKVFENEFFIIEAKPFGEYQTNCYVVNAKNKQESLIIDPGMNATSWVLENAKNPQAILNTHGHFDHIWSNKELKEKLPEIPLICPFEDAFMLTSDCFSLGLPLSTPDILVSECKKDLQDIKESCANTQNLGRENTYTFGDFFVHYICYPGHTPGCSVVIVSHKDKENEKIMFSGDFIFERSIGRSDFPYASSAVMKKSLESFLELSGDMIIFPGHGGSTSLEAEKRNVPYWIARM